MTDWLILRCPHNRKLRRARRFPDYAYRITSRERLYGNRLKQRLNAAYRQKRHRRLKVRP